jgi:hypothetical protein
MSNGELEHIYVVTEKVDEDTSLGPERGPSDLLAKGVTGLSVSLLKENMQTFLDQVGQVFEDGWHGGDAFMLEEVTVSASISADGKVCLLGSGAGLKAQGAITLRLRHKK